MASEWSTARLGDVLTRVKAELTIDDSTVYTQVTVRLWNKGIVVRGEQEGIGIRTKRQFYVRAGQLLMSRIDVRNGAIGFVPERLDGAIVSNDFWAYDVDETKVFPQFLGYYVTTLGFIEDANRTSSGTTKRIRADESSFLDIFFPLPPLDEQRRLVARIEALAARITQAQLLRKESSKASAALLRSCVSQLLEEKTGSWQMATLPELVAPVRYAIKRGPFGSYLRKEFFVDSGYKIYEQQHAIYGDFDAGHYYIDENKFQELGAFEIKPGDVIISCSGTIGKVAIIPDDAEPGIINQALLKLTLDTTKINRLFFKMVFESDFIRKEVEAISPGSAMKNIGSVKVLKELLFPLPSLDEQRRIVAYFDKLQAKVLALQALQEQTAKELDALVSSLLDKAFKGEL